ncbi:hypothetical protein GCK32_022122 [Trichostrongylus colubriformis]|uniref:Uncharacterized protein n=1 Tax=Trichostrongylus colubriformis TaxID=6319 RepID=A0AAN8G6Z0_TRICO
MEKAVEEVQAVIAKEQQRREEAEHPAPIPSHLIQTPKLELPKFAGDITLFPEFWEIFSAAIHNHPYMTDATKLIYLKGALQGDAKDIVASVQVGDDNYSRAVELLQSTYNRPELLRNRLVDQLESLPPATESPLGLRTTLCKVKAIWVQLSSLNEQPGSTMTMKTIRSKFPQKTREKVGELRRRNDNWNTEDLLSALDRVIDQFELMEDTDPTSINASRKDLWINKYDWDDSFDEATTTRYQAIVKDIKGFRKDIPRYINTIKNAKYDLVLFSSLIFSKSKLASAEKATKVGADGSRTGSKASSLHTETAEYRVRICTHPI